MRVRRALWLLLAVAVASPVAAGESKAPKGKKPALDIRPTPRFGFSPMDVHFTAELKGGDDVEDYYCPELEWLWDDGGKSIKESDCPAYRGGGHPYRAPFHHEHPFKDAGIYTVQVTLAARTG